MLIETRCWVNVYRGQYADCTDGKPYYISPGYHTREEALQSMSTPKAKSILDRYITTTEIIMKTINEHVNIFNTLEGATSFFTRTCVSGGKSGRLLTLVEPERNGSYFVDTTRRVQEQLHIVWPEKYIVLKDCPSPDGLNKGAVKVESLGDFVNIAYYGTHMAMYLDYAGKPANVIVLEPATLAALIKFLDENKVNES